MNEEGGQKKEEKQVEKHHAGVGLNELDMETDFGLQGWLLIMILQDGSDLLKQKY